MNIIRRQWTAKEADEWRKEDWIAIVLSVLSYLTLTVGTALSFLLLKSGFAILGFGIILTALMYWIIDPKLKTISQEYEKKQQDYLQRLEEIQKWEESK